jgi:fructuronate reductase
MKARSGQAAQLSNGTLHSLPPEIRPRYDRKAVRTGIVHLGVGAFHRAHQAVYTEAALASGDLRWGIVGASLRGTQTRDALAPQDGLYTVAERGSSKRLQVIGALTRVLVAPESPRQLLAEMCRPDVAVVSLTVTEKGYCHDPATGELDERHPDIVHDLANPRRPRSALGFLLEAVRERRAQGLRPFTPLSCDNLSSNGHTLHRLLVQMARRASPDLAGFIEDEIFCPDTMVDRIVPATTDVDRLAVSEALAVEDAWPVVTEPFRQWVIENRFVSDRPQWERFGATLARNVAPYEMMKLRLLNASHSAIAYIGLLAGYGEVASAMADDRIAMFVARLMDDAQETLDVPEGADIGDYKRSLVERFRNPELHHKTAQIAMDGSQKLPPRILAAVQDRLRHHGTIGTHALVIAAWARCVASQQISDLNDPLASRIASAVHSAGDRGARMIHALLDIEAIFGQELPSHPEFRNAVLAALSLIDTHGAATAARMTSDRP